MGIFDFMRSRRAVKGPSLPNDLVFKSGKDAFDYVQKFMKVDWRPNAIVPTLVAHPVLEKGILSARVLIPKGNTCIELQTVTKIEAVHSKERGRVAIGAAHDLAALGLKTYDLVTVLLAAQDAEYASLVSENDGWIAFIIGRNFPIYSLRDGGWRVDKKYEL